MRHLLALLVLTAPVFIARVASADTHEISIGSTSRTLRTSSANALTGESLSGGALSYAHTLGMEALPGLALWAEGSFGWGSADGTMFQNLSTEISALSCAVGARARYPLRNRIVASARFDLGTARAAVQLRDDAGHSARDSGWGVMSQAALGLDLFAVRRPEFSLGMRLELGYIGASPVQLTAAPSGHDGTLQLEMTTASLGSLNLSGAVFEASVVSDF
jgi:hypothetical protein